MRPASSASLASVRRLASRATLRNLSRRNVALIGLGYDARAARTHNDEWFVDDVGCAWGEIRACRNDLACFKAHRARSGSDFRDLAVGLDEISRVDGSEKLNALVCGKESFVAVVLDQQLRC